MVGGILDVMKQLADEGLTMIIETMKWDLLKKSVIEWCFMDQGVIAEEGTPEEIFIHQSKSEQKPFYIVIYQIACNR